MSAVITMPNAIDESIRACCAEAVQQAVTALAAKYGFDVEEAHRELAIDEMKLVRKRGPTSKKSVSKPDGKAKAKSGRVSEPKAPKRLTGYLMFSGEKRAEIREQLLAELEEGEKLKPQAVVSALAALWKSLSNEERLEWNAKAKIDEVEDEEEDEIEIEEE